MANITPSALPSLKKNGGLFRELDVIERLRQSLPDNYEIFHSVPLHIVSTNADHFTEIDILVLAPGGQVLLVEVKAGNVVSRDGSLYKTYSNNISDISRQFCFQYNAFRSRLKEVGIDTYVNNCLVIPDCILADQEPISVPRERIIDASRYDYLGTYVKEFLSTGKGCSDIGALKRFLNNEFQVNEDVSVLKNQLQTTVRQLADGLSTWVPRITSPSGVFKIQATAGSGKTQLALSLLNSALAKSETVAYICYNRTLADHLRHIAPARAFVSNFDELCVEHFRRHHGEPDFTQAKFFEQATSSYLKDSQDFTPKFDLLIIDEAQDFEAEWLESLASQLKDDGRLFILQDDDQRLYKRTEFDVSEAVQIECQDNFRSPKLICDVINTLSLTNKTIQSKNPFKGELPNFHEYCDRKQLLEATAAAVDNLLAQGFDLNDIVVLTACGRDRSKLLAEERIGKYRTRQFTGRYTTNGDPIWTTGELLVESVYRYKGQSSPAIVLSEIDFSELDLKEKRKLFVGMTRSQVALELVLSTQATKIFSELIIANT